MGSPAALSTPPSPSLPDGIEVFAPGRRTSDAGDVYDITAADVAATAAAYDPELHEAPLVVGHPEHDLPAYGWAKRMRVSTDGRLLMDSHGVDAAFAEMVGAGRFKKRSISFYLPADPANPKPGIWYPRHIGFLGAKPPSVKGLKDIPFNLAESTRAVNFSEPINPQERDMSKELQDQLDAANRKLADEQTKREAAERAATEATGKLTASEQAVANFSEAAARDRHAANASFAESQVEAGKLLPKDKATAIAVLDSLAAGAKVEFSEGDAKKTVSPAEFVKSLITGSTPKVNFGEQVTGTRFDGNPLAVKGDDDAAIDLKAKAYAATHKVNYGEALAAVTASFTS